MIKQSPVTFRAGELTRVNSRISTVMDSRDLDPQSWKIIRRLHVYLYLMLNSPLPPPLYNVASNIVQGGEGVNSIALICR